MIAPTAPLIGAGFALLALVALVDQLYARDRQAQRSRARAELIASIYGPAPVRPDALSAARRHLDTLPWTERWAARIFRIETGQRDLYPVPWWALLAGTSLIALIAAALATKIAGSAAWLGFPELLVVLARIVFGHYRSKRQLHLYRQMPDALSMIVRAVRAGLPVTEALRSVGQDAAPPTSQEFGRLANDLAIGRTLQDSLIAMALRTALQEYRFFAVALALQGQTGGNLAETLENLADVVRKRVALRARAYALAAEARMTANVLIALPFITGGALAFVAPAYIAVLFLTAKGQRMLFLAIGLLGLGVLTMRTMIKRSLS